MWLTKQNACLRYKFGARAVTRVVKPLAQYKVMILVSMNPERQNPHKRVLTLSDFNRNVRHQNTPAGHVNRVSTCDH